MAALTQDLQIPSKGPVAKLGIKAVGADTFYAGAAVFGDGTNGKAQVVPAAGDFFLGICAEQTVASAADEIVPVYVTGLFLIPFTGAGDENDVGNLCILDISATQSDNFADWLPASEASGGIAANDISAGLILAVEGSAGWVLLHAQPSLYVATAGWGG